MPRSIRNPKSKIKKVLAENKTPLTWRQLLKNTELSKGALSKHLSDLIDNKIVETSATNDRPPKTLYTLREQQPISSMPKFKSLNDWKRFVFQITAQAFQHGVKISHLKDRTLARKVLKEYFNSNLQWINSYILLIFPLAYSFTQGFEDKRRVSKVSRLLVRKKEYNVFIERVNQQTHELIEPWIEALANTVLINQDIATDIDSVPYELGNELAEKINLDWYDILESNLTKR